MKGLLIGDMHVWSLSPDWHDFFYPKRLLGFINLALHRRTMFPPSLRRTVLNRVVEEDADVVIFAGDLTGSSQNDEFALAATLLRPIQQKWGDKFFLIPGNHDRYTPRSVAERRYERHFPESSASVDINAPLLVQQQNINGDLSVVGFDASQPMMLRSNGAMSEELLTQLEKAMQDASAHQNPFILVGHYPYALPPGKREPASHKLINSTALQQLINRHSPLAYLHGHKHTRWCFTPQATPRTMCIGCPALAMLSANPEKKAGFITFDIQSAEISSVHAHLISQGGQATVSRMWP